MGEKRSLRVLCTSTPGTGHIGALAPVAMALREACHSVGWAVAAEVGPKLEALGFEWHPAGLGLDERNGAAMPEMPRILQIPPAERRGALFSTAFCRIAAPPMRDSLAPLVDALQPDVIVREAAELAAVPVAFARGIPLVTVAFSGDLPSWTRPETLEALQPLWDAEDLGEVSWSQLGGDLYVHPFPPSFGQRPSDGRVVDFCPSSAPPAGDQPGWLEAFDGVYVTAGTEVPSMLFPWPAVVQALRAISVPALLTIGPHVDESTLGDVPPTIRVERFVPQGWVLPKARLVVSHGGAGSVLGAAAAGVPQLVIPVFADQWENAQAVSDAGVGVVLDMEQRSAESIASAIAEVLSSGSVAAAVERVRVEVSAMPGPAAVVLQIESLVA